MNSKQRAVVWLTIAAVTASLVIAPWQVLGTAFGASRIAIISGLLFFLFSVPKK